MDAVRRFHKHELCVSAAFSSCVAGDGPTVEELRREAVLGQQFESVFGVGGSHTLREPHVISAAVVLLQPAMLASCG